MDKFQRELMIVTICNTSTITEEQALAFTTQLDHEFKHNAYTLTYPMVRLARLLDYDKYPTEVHAFTTHVLLKADIQKYNNKRET